MSALGQKQTCAVQKRMSGFTPNSDRESGFPQTVMSALPPKADIIRVSARLVRQIDCRWLQIEDINIQLHRGRIIRLCDATGRGRLPPLCFP